MHAHVHTHTHPVIELQNEVIGCFPRAKLEIQHSIHAQLSDGDETTCSQVLAQLCRIIQQGET